MSSLARGPRLLAMIALAIAALVTTIVLTSDDGLVATAARVVRWTARSSILLFALAYVARPAYQLWSEVCGPPRGCDRNDALPRPDA